VHYWNTKRQGFLPECEGFSFEQYLWIADSRIFCGFLRQGASVLMCSAQASSRIRLRKTRFTDAKIKEIIAVQAQKSKVLYLLPIFKHP
jgi:hypothetical protein